MYSEVLNNDQKNLLPLIKSFVPEYKFRLLDINPLDTIGEKILCAYL